MCVYVYMSALCVCICVYSNHTSTSKLSLIELHISLVSFINDNIFSEGPVHNIIIVSDILTILIIYIYI